jgi:hypothetical protein
MQNGVVSATNPVMGVVSGALATATSASQFFYGTLDNFNLPLLESTSTGNTLWSYSCEALGQGEGLGRGVSQEADQGESMGECAGWRGGCGHACVAV